MKKRLPGVWKGMSVAGFGTGMLTTQWIVTLFCQIFSRRTTNKIWLLFFMSGWPVILDTALYLIEILGNKFLMMGSTDWGEFISGYKETINRSD